MNAKVKEIMSWIASLFLYLGIALLIRYFVFNITAVDGMSMYPTLDNGDKLITQRVSLYFREPEVGEVVVFKNPLGKEHFIKRVIAREGDQVEVKDGQVLVNGEAREENFINGNETLPNYPDQTSWQVGEGEIFVMGDNRGASNDSRSFGPIKIKSLVGISEFRVYPFSKIGKL